MAFHRRGLIQIGLLALIATPIARVTFSVFAFLYQRDWEYVAFTLIVLGLLLYSLLGRGWSPPRVLSCGSSSRIEVRESIRAWNTRIPEAMGYRRRRSDQEGSEM